MYQLAMFLVSCFHAERERGGLIADNRSINVPPCVYGMLGTLHNK